MFDYFYENQTKSFRFIKVPTVLLEEKEFEILTAEVILLYSIMLQRVTLSYKTDGQMKKGKYTFTTQQKKLKKHLAYTLKISKDTKKP